MREMQEYNENIFFLDPNDVKVKEGLERFRKDMGELKKLAESIVRYGQLQPVVLTRENELIVGGRRLAACALAGKQVKAIYKDVVDTIVMRELELEEKKHGK